MPSMFSYFRLRVVTRCDECALATAHNGNASQAKLSRVQPTTKGPNLACSSLPLQRLQPVLPISHICPLECCTSNPSFPFAKSSSYRSCTFNPSNEAHSTSSRCTSVRWRPVVSIYLSFPCTPSFQCNTFNSYIPLQKHVNSVHRKVKVYKCPMAPGCSYLSIRCRPFNPPNAAHSTLISLYRSTSTACTGR